MDGTKVRLSRR